MKSAIRSSSSVACSPCGSRRSAPVPTAVTAAGVRSAASLSACTTVAMRFGRQLPGAIYPELAHVCLLAVTLIAALRLSKGIVCARHVEYVVDDLKQHAELRGKKTKRDGRRSIRDPSQQ